MVTSSIDQEKHKRMTLNFESKICSANDVKSFTMQQELTKLHKVQQSIREGFSQASRTDSDLSNKNPSEHTSDLNTTQIKRKHENIMPFHILNTFFILYSKRSTKTHSFRKWK